MGVQYCGRPPTDNRLITEASLVKESFLRISENCLHRVPIDGSSIQTESEFRSPPPQWKRQTLYWQLSNLLGKSVVTLRDNSIEILTDEALASIVSKQLHIWISSNVRRRVEHVSYACPVKDRYFIEQINARKLDNLAHFCRLILSISATISSCMVALISDS
jgi:hypothetical protein